MTTRGRTPLPHESSWSPALKGRVLAEAPAGRCVGGASRPLA